MTETFVKVGVSLRERLKELNDTECRVLFALGLRINEERQCWPTKSILAQECARSERQVQRSIGNLITKNFVWVGRRAGGRGKPNIYTLNGYFAYGTQPVQLMAPFMAPAEAKGDMGVPVSAQKGDIPIVADVQKGDMGVQKRETSPQSGPVHKKNHIRRTIKEEGEKGDMGRQKGDPRVREVALALESERGGKSPNYGGEAKAIKWMLEQGHSPEDILACRRAMKRDPWWGRHELLLMSVQKEIQQWSKGGRHPDWFEKGAHGEAGRYPQKKRPELPTREDYEREAQRRGQRDDD